MTNLIVALYTEQYKIIHKDFLTNLSDDEIVKLNYEIQKSALKCQFPIEKKALTENIMVSVGSISKDYLNYQILNKERAEVLEGKVLGLNRISIPEKITFLLENIDKPMHYTEIAELYKKHFAYKKEISKLEHSVHCYILDSKDFILLGRGMFMLRNRFKVPDNIKIIVKTSEEILRSSGNISDTRYLIRELKKRKIDTGNLNLYSLKTILLEYPNFVGYRKSEVGIEELTTKSERKSLGDLMYEVLVSAHQALHIKEIHKRILKTRGFKEISVVQKLFNDTAFIKIAPATYTVRENIPLYEDKRKIIIDFAQKWCQIKQRPISTFLVNEVLKETEKITDLSFDFVEYVLEKSPKFTKERKGFYSLVEIC